MEITGNNPGPTKGITGAQLVTSIPDNFFALGKAFTYQDYSTFAAAQVKNFIFNPIPYTAPPGGQDRIVGFFPSIFAEAGPIRMDIFFGTDEAGDGDDMIIFNRDSTSLNAPQSTLKLNPSVITDDGTRFTGIGIPASAVGGGFHVGSSVEDALPFALDTNHKYLIRLTNDNGADTLVTMRFTFFEI